MLLAVEGRRRNIPLLWSYLALGQLVSLPFAQNLFFIALILTPTPLPLLDYGTLPVSRFVQLHRELWDPVADIKQIRALEECNLPTKAGQLEAARVPLRLSPRLEFCNPQRHAILRQYPFFEVPRSSSACLDICAPGLAELDSRELGRAALAPSPGIRNVYQALQVHLGSLLPAARQSNHRGARLQRASCA